MWPAGSLMSSLPCNVITVLSRDCPQAIYNATMVNELVMYQSIPTAIIPPGQPPRDLTSLRTKLIGGCTQKICNL